MSESGGRKCYHISPRRRGVLVAVLLLFMIFLATTGWYLSDSALLIVTLLVGMILAVIFAIAAWWYPWLSVGPEGVELHQFGWCLTTTWENVAGVRLTVGGEGLILNRPMSGRGAARLAACGKTGVGFTPFCGPDQLQLIAERRFIPLEPFACWFRHGDLRERISRHAPWVASGFEAETSETHEPN